MLWKGDICSIDNSTSASCLCFIALSCHCVLPASIFAIFSLWYSFSYCQYGRLRKDSEVRVDSSPACDIANDQPHPNRAFNSDLDEQSGWDDWWIWEIIGVVVSAAAICAIIGLLIRVDGKKLENWGFTIPDKTIREKFIPAKTVVISLNSVISWISTVGKICILIPITKGIGQLKCG